MITPHFEVSQDADFVEVRIKVPHLKMEDGEFYVDGHEFKFHLRPYFLRLTFKQELTEDGRETATHDVSTGILTVRMPKATPGEHFEDLGMLSELLRKPDRSAARSGGPLIEVLSSTEHASAEDGESVDAEAMDDAALEAEAEVEQALPTTDELLGRARYGFNDAYSGVFVGLEGEEDLLQLREPERATPRERREARLQAEDDAFDADHYIADLMDDAAVQAALSYRPWWWAADPAAAAAAASANAALASEEGAAAAAVDAAEAVAAAGAAGPSSSSSSAAAAAGDDATRWLPIGSEEQQQLLQLPRKEFLMGGAAAERRALCGLLDVLFAYCYEVRSTEGEPTVESGWTVAQLSSLLSFLDSGFAHEGVAEAATACVRRALCRPLLRHWALAQAALDDAARLLALGRGAVLAALLRCRALLQRHLDLGYLLNRVWLDDYCVWVQQLPAPQLARLGAELGALRLPKEAVGWPLDEYERLAREDAEEMEEEEMGGDYLSMEGAGTLV